MNIRIGNDIPMVWRFYTGRKIGYSMENRDLRLYMTDPAGRKESLNFTVSGNALLFTFYGRDQRRTGEYTLTLVENEGQPGMLTIDKIRPFCLTPLQETVHGGIVAGAVSELEIRPYELESSIGMALPYLSLERLRHYLYRITFDALPPDDGGDSMAFGGCSSFVRDGNLYASEGLLATGYLLQVLVTDGTTTYALLPPAEEGQPYVLQDITSNPKLTNFRWVSRSTVTRSDADIQTRPTGIERFNIMPCDPDDLRFTLAYEIPDRLSEFIGLRDTTKDSTDEELASIYADARALYLDRERDGLTWHTMHSVVYGDRMEELYIQENWNDNCAL